MVRTPTKKDWEIWRKMVDPRTPAQRKADEEAQRDKQRNCRHDWAHRNDGKISTCYICHLVRDNEP